MAKDHDSEEEEEGFYKFLPANTADRLCQSWQSCEQFAGVSFRNIE